MGVIGARLCRQSTVFLVCAVDFVWLMANFVVNSRLKKALALLIMVSVLSWCLLWTRRMEEIGHFTPWNPSGIASKPPQPKVFVRGVDDDIYMYSAIANYHQPVNQELNIVITALDASRDYLRCCVLLDNSTLYTTDAVKYFYYHTLQVPVLSWIKEQFQPEVYFARQHVCTVPHIGHKATHVTLSSKSCSSDIGDYLPIVHPPTVPGGLAVCAKIAHSGGIDPEKFIEWMEVQRIMGVDKVLIFDLGNPESLTRVFKHYQKLGVLDVLPYELPGLPQGRTLMEKDKHQEQFHHDETMSVLECRQRMAGYTFVMSHDVDEFIVPRTDVDLKTFFKKKLEVHKDAAGFFFYAEFFIYNWGPTNPEEDLMLTRYRKTTLPHWECTKYVYLPSRTISTVTHSIYQRKPFSTYIIPMEEAILHHYRQCPEDTWGSCFPDTMVDHVMTRFPLKHDLYNRVKAVRKVTDTRTQWTVSKHNVS